MKIVHAWRSDLLNMIAAAIIALLVWAYANDRTRESATVSGTIRLGVADPRAQYIEPVSAVPISLEVRGSRRALERLEDELRAGIALTAGMPAMPASAGPHTLELSDVLAAVPSIASTGAEIIRARPQSMRYEVGALVTEQVPVTAIMPSTAVQGAIVVDPPVAAVTLPEAARKAVGALTLDAVVETKNLEPGRPNQIDVDLRMPDALGRWKELYRVVPPRAKVSFTLLATTAEHRIATMPVRLALPPEAASWEVALVGGDETVHDIVVTGPRSAIDELRAGTFQPAAVVDVRPDQLAPGIVALPITFWRLPEGVNVMKAGRSAATATPSVQVRIMPRTSK